MVRLIDSFIVVDRSRVHPDLLAHMFNGLLRSFRGRADNSVRQPVVFLDPAPDRGRVFVAAICQGPLKIVSRTGRPV